MINEADTSIVLHASKVTLSFDYYAYPKGKQTLDNLEVTLSPKLFGESYLILSFYAFSNKKYRQWYQRGADQTFAVDVIYPNSGILIRNK